MTTTEPAVIDARFAGGPILVSTSGMAGVPVVQLELPGQGPVPMFEHEARALSAALAEAAQAVSPKNAPARQARRDEGEPETTEGN